MVSAYVCPERFVSRVIYFSTDPDIAWFKKFLLTQVDEEIVHDRDLRPATRHGWELARDALIEIRNASSKGVLSEVYWTTYPKTNKEKRRGIFLCSNAQKGEECRRLFIKEVNSPNRLCPKCR
jgi:hypothetical protein